MAFLGAHVSISGGVENSISRGVELGCEAVQIFSKNQRQWKSAPLSEKSIREFRENIEKSPLKQVVIHDSYLINLAHPDRESRQKSIDSFIDEMIRADQLNIPYLVFHPGSHLKSGEEAGIGLIADSLNRAIDKQHNGSVMLLVETTAGQGDNLGYRFEQIAEIISNVENKKRMGVCFDTAHAFEAGYDIRTEQSYKKTFEEFDRIIGLERLRVFHLNDSKTEIGSHVDRHENIGKGLMGEEPFRMLVNDKRFSNHAMILETPGGDEMYKVNLSLLKSFRIPKNVGGK